MSPERERPPAATPGAEQSAWVGADDKATVPLASNHHRVVECWLTLVDGVTATHLLGRFGRGLCGYEPRRRRWVCPCDWCGGPQPVELPLCKHCFKLARRHRYAGILLDERMRPS